MSSWSRLDFRDSGLAISRGLFSEIEAVNVFGFNRTVGTNKTIFIRNNLKFPSGVEYNVAEASFNASQVSYDRQIPFRINEKTDFSFTSKSDSGTNEVFIFVEAVLVKD